MMTVSDYISDGLTLFFSHRRNATYSNIFPNSRIIFLPTPHNHPVLYKRYNNYTYVGYYPSVIQYNNIQNMSGSGISCYFSGCAMAYFLFNGTPYVAHIPLEDKNSAYIDQRDNWNNFIIRNKRFITKYVIFRPFKSSDQDLLRYRSISSREGAIGIIQPDLSCYTFMVDDNYFPIFSKEIVYPSKLFTTNLCSVPDISQYTIPKRSECPLWW